MKKLLTLIFLLSVLAAAPAFAVPAFDRIVVRIQPDGSRVELRLRGDEFGSWYEGADGAAVVRSKSGRYDFAKKDARGALISSGVKYSAKAARPASAVKNYKPQASAAAARLRGAKSESSVLAESSGWHSRPAQGDRNLMVVLVSFQNAVISADSDDHAQRVWTEGSDVLSVRQYYKDQSHGKLNIVSADSSVNSGTPFGIVEITMTSADVYSGDHPDRYLNDASMKSYINSHLNECAVVQNIIDKVADKYHIDFSEFDKDGDGKISQKELCFYMIFGGYEESFGGYIDADHPMVWAHAWSSWESNGEKHQVNINGKMLTDWAMQGELGYALDKDGSERDLLLPGVGTMTHELGHQMCKLPDLYDVNNQNSGIGVYSVMGGGSWGAASGEIVGTRPTNLDAWSRIYLGWETPTKMTASKSGASATFRKAGTLGGIVRIESPALDCSTEYILAEVRDLTSKWDAGFHCVGEYNAAADLAGGALLLLHVDENVGSGTLDKGNDFNSSANPHQGVMPIAADCDYRIKAVPNATNMWYSGNKYVDSFGSEIGDYVAGRTYFYGDKAKYSSRLRSGIALCDFSAPGGAMTAVVYYDEKDEDEGSAANPVKPVIDNRTAELIATFAPGVMHSKSLAASILASADIDLTSDDLAYDTAHQVTLTKQAVKRAAPSVVGVYPLPVFRNVIGSDKNSIALSFAVASADLLAKTPSGVQLLKITGKQSAKFFTYTDDPDDFIKDGYFTIQTDDDTGEVVSRDAVLADDSYRVTLFLKDDGSFDLSKADNVVLDPAAIVTTENSGKSSGGCSAGFGGLALLLAIALVPAARGRKK